MYTPISINEFETIKNIPKKFQILFWQLKENKIVKCKWIAFEHLEDYRNIMLPRYSYLDKTVSYKKYNIATFPVSLQEKLFAQFGYGLCIATEQFWSVRKFSQTKID